MISYKIDSDGKEINLKFLEELVEKHKKGWIKRAKERTEKYKLAGKVTDSSHIWSEIKEVLMKLQGNKCAFCERELEGVEFGKGAIDVEHFRPKNNVRKWKVSDEFKELGIPITDPKKSTGGYHLLSYNLLNYTIACGPCNQAIKSDVFPISGDYNTSMEDPISESSGEKPLLIYPLGKIDQDCEELIEFNGSIPRSKKALGSEFQRAMSTIEFFSLGNANTRGILFKERCELIILLGVFLDPDLGGGTPTSLDIVRNFTLDTSKHANCARSYVKLFNIDPNKAKEIFAEAKEFLKTYVPN